MAETRKRRDRDGDAATSDEIAESDPVGTPPPSPSFRRASSAPPSDASFSDGGMRALLMAGASPSAVVLNGIKTIEQAVLAIDQHVHGFAVMAAPALEQWRATAEVGLADRAAGQSGMPSAALSGSSGAGGMGMTPPPPMPGMPGIAPPPPPPGAMPPMF